MGRWCIWIGLVLGLIMELPAQSYRSARKAEEGYQGAMLLYKKRQYAEALRVVEQALTYDKKYAALYFLRADICHKLGDPDGETLSIEQGLALDSVKHTGYYFFLAENYLDQGVYDKALRAYTCYLEKDKKRNQVVRACRQLENCKFALKALQMQTEQPVEVYMESPAEVYWPSLDVRGKTVLYTELKEGVENIRMREQNRDYSLNINSSNNEGTQSLTADGQMMYFTGCGRPDSRGSCDIYVAYRISDTVWSEPVNLGEPVNTDAWEAQPSVSADGTRLFFASNRPGGRGGSDIWYSVLMYRGEDGRQIWSQPKLLYFNTPGQEMAPYLYYDNRTLFFASDGYPGMGGMDIYKVNLDSVSEPQNIGITVNTCKDEMGFAVDATGRRGYFTSGREGRKRIYRYTLEPEISCPEVGYVRFVVKNEKNEEIVPDQLAVQALGGGDTLAFYNGGYRPAKMLAAVPLGGRILVSVLKSGYLYFSDTLHVGKRRESQEQVREIVLKKIRKEASFVLKGIYFDVDDYTLRPESVPELNQLIAFLQQNPEVKIEIAGHTDNSGTDEHNYRLSENRAFEVYKYLFLHRIKKERMSYKGYGKDRPVASNETGAGKAQNRRTEIRITEE